MTVKYLEANVTGNRNLEEEARAHSSVIFS
jgi:hypothetical protein